MKVACWHYLGKMVQRTSSSGLSVLLVAITALPAMAQTGTSPWNRFRGPNGTGIAEGSYPAEVGPEQAVIWKRAFPEGHSSPVFSAELMILTAVEDGHLYTYAIDRDSGETVWRAQAPRPRRTKFHGKNGPAAASAAVDADTVAVFFDEYGMLAYDHDGKERWRMPLGPFFNIYGMGASPIIVDDTVVLPCDDGKASYVIGVDKHTGAVRYKVDRPDAVSGHCTPVIYRPEGQAPQFILPGSFLLDAYDAKTGDRIWWIRGLPSEMKSVPVLLGDTLWIHGYGSPQNNKGRQIELQKFTDAVTEMDKDGDGMIAREELTDRRISRYYMFLDLDKSGALDASEWRISRQTFASVNAAMAVRVGGAGDMTAESVLWRYYRSIPQLPSPLIAGGVYYLLSDQGGLMTTIRADTGEFLEKGRVGEAGDAYFTAPVCGDGKVYLLSESGLLTVLAVGGGLEPIHSVDFGEPCFATPALVDGKVWIRTHSHLYCFGAKK
jgi:outer membrane protein assembly factor BamB